MAQLWGGTGCSANGVGRHLTFWSIETKWSKKSISCQILHRHDFDPYYLPPPPPPPFPRLREYDKEPTRLSAPPEDNPPPVEPTSRYRKVNVSGILPEVVRTPDNLEGEDIPIDRAQALLEQHRKQEEKRYEETELKRLRSETNYGHSS